MARDDNGPPRAETDAAPCDPAPRRDVVLLGPKTSDGEGVHVLRARENRLETGELRNLVDGRPITGEIVKLSPREDNPRVCDVVERFEATPQPRTKGPAQVATRAYRDNWDEVFGKSSGSRDLN